MADIENPSHSKIEKDWRLELFGPFIEENKKDTFSNEQSFIPTEVALDRSVYEYVAIFFGADYCPHCKLFAPKLVDSHSKLVDKKCKVTVASNDRTVEAFDSTRRKLAGIDLIPYDTSRTRLMRDLFHLKTIPAVVILKNALDCNRESLPVVTTNARNELINDPNAVCFPWPDESAASSRTVSMDTPGVVDAGHTKEKLSNWDRFLVNGKYGNWYDLGHRANQDHPENIYMDEHAVRIRAGLLNIISWVALINVFFWKSRQFAKIVFPIVGWEFVASGLFGLTPLAPIGTVSTALAIILHPEPYWKPAKPKRFAWAIGLVLSSSCFVFYMLRDNFGDEYTWIIGGVVLTCNFFTWAESSCGFCFGCFVYNNYLVPMIGLEECSECKI